MNFSMRGSQKSSIANIAKLHRMMSYDILTTCISQTSCLCIYIIDKILICMYVLCWHFLVSDYNLDKELRQVHLDCSIKSLIKIDSISNTIFHTFLEVRDRHQKDKFWFDWPRLVFQHTDQEKIVTLVILACSLNTVSAIWIKLGQ